MTGLDLTGVRTVLDQWLVDDLRVLGEQGSVDGSLDETTGLIADEPDPVVWAGHGAVQDLTAAGVDEDPDTVTVVRETGATHRALIRLGEQIPDPQLEHVLEVVAVHSPSASPGLQGTRYRIVRVGGESSFSVVQILWLVEA